MASNTKITEYRRKIRHDNMGARRKRHARLHGITLPFAIHTPDADANAPAEQVAPKAE